MRMIVDLTIAPRSGQTLPEAEAEFSQLLTEYLTSGDGPFMGDYGRDAWGGYEGPFVDAVTVQRDDIEVTDDE